MMKSWVCKWGFRKSVNTEDTQNLECEDKSLQNCLLVPKTEDLAVKPEDWRYKFLTVNF